VKRSIFVYGFLCLVLATVGHFESASQTQTRIVVLGSSTASGCCASSGNGWVDLYRSYLKSIGYPDSSVINLAIGGYTTFKILPTGYVSPYRSVKTLWDIAPAVNNNITKALTFNPTHIIINLPTNDANDLVFPVPYQLDHYTTVISQALARGVQVLVCTSQPRNTSATIRKMLIDMRDSTFNRYGSSAVDFWTSLATDSGTIVPLYNSGDGVHLNDAGHQILYERVKAKLGINPALTASPAPLSFGDVALGSSRQLTSTVTNKSSSALTLATIVTGTSSYSVSPSSATVAAGGSFTVTVTYTPAALGQASDVVSFRYASGLSVLTLSVSGNSPVPVATVTPPSLDFGEVAKGANKQLTVHITNPSINTMTVSSITKGLAIYTLDRTSATIAPSQTVDVTVKFSPSGVGAYPDTLLLAGNASNFPLRVPLTGRSPVPTLSVDPAALDFGDVKRFTSKSLRLRMRNLSANALDVTGFTTTNVEYSTNIASLRVNAADSADVLVTFSPISLGTAPDTLYVVNNSSFSPLKVPLSGRSPAPQLQVNTTVLAFPQYTGGDTVKLPVKMYNRSINTLNFSSIQNSLAHFRLLGSLPSSIPGNDSVTIVVGFVPRTGGVWTDTVAIISDGGTAHVAMSGTAPVQKLLAKPNPVAFGNVKVGESITVWCRIVRMYPAEGGTVPVDSTIVHSHRFSIVAVNGPSSLSAGDTLFVALAFHPAGMGDVSDTLLIFPNGSTPIVGVPISGIGSSFTSVDAYGGNTPIGFQLAQNYPNPFNPQTEISFRVAELGSVKLQVFDLLGRTVATLVDDERPAGSYTVRLDAAGLASGVYLYRLAAGRFVETRKMILAR
jgi:lysophospholipase L1-like esterase